MGRTQWRPLPSLRSAASPPAATAITGGRRGLPSRRLPSHRIQRGGGCGCRCFRQAAPRLPLPPGRCPVTAAETGKRARERERDGEREREAKLRERQSEREREIEKDIWIRTGGETRRIWIRHALIGSSRYRCLFLKKTDTYNKLQAPFFKKKTNTQVEMPVFLQNQHLRLLKVTVFMCFQPAEEGKALQQSVLALPAHIVPIFGVIQFPK